MIISDLKRFKQVLFNLIGNAVKFTFKGAITLKTDFIDNQMVVDVIDTGVGIKEEDLDKLLKFFGCLTRTKDINRGGMGLGLTISKAILQQLGGEINVVSEFEKGSNFKFKIPISEFEYSED